MYLVNKNRLCLDRECLLSDYKTMRHFPFVESKVDVQLEMNSPLAASLVDAVVIAGSSSD